MGKKLEPLVFEWSDRIVEMQKPGTYDPLSLDFQWGTLKFDEKEAIKIRRLRPFYGDKVRIKVEFLRGRLREANEEREE